ncbi:hypothetical protein BOTCAL_0046g00050 [Botryotinia calthae]|uniref:Uncharacterized protein n=1 Tax=Botryotinia calthae TaxID=38488 RepID=A0A4Y8DDU4_9HELO|nr:hypothetical protein BOTCAL_0046g00050 [Botryotinia calthae]
MNTAVSDFYSLCHKMGHPPPAFISGAHVQVTAAADLMTNSILRRPEGQTMEWHEAMRLFTERLAQRLNEGSS